MPEDLTRYYVVHYLDANGEPGVALMCRACPSDDCFVEDSHSQMKLIDLVAAAHVHDQLHARYGITIPARARRAARTGGLVTS